ncbi:MAG: hypothetical protein PUK64_09645 [bacterium]|nr:hypothetical protein [bacterium]MDD7723233.1 hypothetical protein [bacterium]MDY4103234.1 hypothetical protein [Parabacteroides sp.]
MEERINQINLSIDEKRNRLKEKAELCFASITIPSSTGTEPNEGIKQGSKIPPVSYLLYGIAGLSAIGAIVSDSKMLCLGIAAASAFGGYKLSQVQKSNTTVGTSTDKNWVSVKNEVVTKVLDIVKRTTNEWESFMESKQKEVQEIIAHSSLEDPQKEELSSKLFLYEVIDISVSEFSAMMNTVASVSDIRQKLSIYKSKLLTSIDEAASRQIAKYKTVCN